MGPHQAVQFLIYRTPSPVKFIVNTDFPHQLSLVPPLNRRLKQYFLYMDKFKNTLLILTETARVSLCQSLPQQCYMSAGFQPPVDRSVPCPVTGSSELGLDPQADVTAWPGLNHPHPLGAGCYSWPPPACCASGWQWWGPRLLPPRVQVALTVPQFPQPLWHE